jgi:hypothetical protein
VAVTIHRPLVSAAAIVVAVVVACGVVPANVLAAVRLPTTKAELTELGRQHRTAWDLYKALQEQANGGKQPTGAE